MKLLAQAFADGGDIDPAALLAAIPYCRHLGLAASMSAGGLVLAMPFMPHLIGNVVTPALHGGVIGSLLETAAIAQVIVETKCTRLPKPVDITVDYLRAARTADSFARAKIARQGRRVVNVTAQMWQDDETKPVAALRGHFLTE